MLPQARECRLRSTLLLGCILAAVACVADRGREGLIWDIGPRTWALVSHTESSRQQSVHVFMPERQNAGRLEFGIRNSGIANVEYLNT